MKKIIVTTDLSKNSKSGLAFAIQLATQYNVKLIFFHAIELTIPTRWNDVKAKIHMDEEIQAETNNLRNLVAQTYKEYRRRPGKFDCVVRYGAPVSQAILDYAKEVNASYICMSTRGAGKFKRLLGTHTSTLIKKSPIPVFAIPKNHKASAIKEILYASDFTALRKELRTIRSFAKNVDSAISVLHYDYFIDPDATQKTFEKITNQSGLSDVKFHLEKLNREETLGKHLRRAARKLEVDVVALFSDHKRPWLVRLLEGSKSAEASFNNVVPLLVYPK
jgi:nucleotide-binding universal stress UspA family protein